MLPAQYWPTHQHMTVECRQFKKENCVHPQTSQAAGVSVHRLTISLAPTVRNTCRNSTSASSTSKKQVKCPSIEGCFDQLCEAHGFQSCLARISNSPTRAREVNESSRSLRSAAAFKAFASSCTTSTGSLQHRRASC